MSRCFINLCDIIIQFNLLNVSVTSHVGDVCRVTVLLNSWESMGLVLDSKRLTGELLAHGLMS